VLDVALFLPFASRFRLAQHEGCGGPSRLSFWPNRSKSSCFGTVRSWRSSRSHGLGGVSAEGAYRAMLGDGKGVGAVLWRGRDALVAVPSGTTTAWLHPGGVLLLFPASSSLLSLSICILGPWCCVVCCHRRWQRRERTQEPWAPSLLEPRLRAPMVVSDRAGGNAPIASNGTERLRGHCVEGTRSRTLRDPEPAMPTCSRQGKRGFAWGRRR
jgi:hypothetical protein